ncbi:unnamed protein product, partial [marine sediment metagenome]
KALKLLSQITGTLLNLTDTPGSYGGMSEKYLRVKGDESALEFVDG